MNEFHKIIGKSKIIYRQYCSIKRFEIIPKSIKWECCGSVCKKHVVTFQSNGFQLAY